MEKSLAAFKEVVTKIKSQLHEKRDEELATRSDVNLALTNLFRDTGLAKVRFSSIVRLLCFVNVNTTIGHSLGNS